MSGRIVGKDETGWVDDMLADNWLDWLTVFGYLSFTLFVAWRVFASPTNK